MRRVFSITVVGLLSLLVVGAAVAQKSGSDSRLQPPKHFVPTPTGPTVFCSTPGLAIPDDDASGVSDSQAISGGALADLDVSINTTHTWVGDLRFELEHVDTGTSVVFYDRPGEPLSTFGCSGDDIDATIDDEAGTAVEDECGDGVPSIDGSFIGGDPANASLMSAFDGEVLDGTWLLTVSDNAGGDTGVLNEWCVIADSSAGCNLAATARNKVQAGKMLAVNIDLVHNRPATVTVPFWIWIEDAAGNVIASKSTRAMTIKYRDHIQRKHKIKIPPLTPVGSYTVFVNIREMKQGDADASYSFQIVP